MNAKQTNEQILDTFRDPKQIDAATRVIGTLIPTRDQLPEEYRKNWRGNDYCEIATNLFFQGGHLGTLKQGIDSTLATDHIYAVLGSYEPQHEHKIGAAGWLLSNWLEF